MTDPIMLERLQRAYDRLPKRHAAIFSAKMHDRLPYAVIAERTGLTPEQVRLVMADVLHRLRCDLDDQERGITRGPIRRFVYECRWRVRFALRLRRERG